MCNTDFNITICCADSHSKDDKIDVTVAMMWHDFSLPIIDNMAKFLQYFDVWLELLPLLVLLVYENTKFLGSYFQVWLDFEEIICLMYITEEDETYALQITTRWMNCSKFLLACQVTMMPGTDRHTLLVVIGTMCGTLFGCTTVVQYTFSSIFTQYLFYCFNICFLLHTRN